MHNKGKYKQGENTAFRMGGSKSKQSIWQRHNLKKLKVAPTAQLQTKEWPIQKTGRRTKQWQRKTEVCALPRHQLHAKIKAKVILCVTLAQTEK